MFMDSKSILFVDDEKNILKALNRAFIDEGYNLYFAENGDEALNIVRNNKIDLVIADMKMPNMNGYELLKKIKEEQPYAIRIMLSGYADERLILKAIQTNLVKLYILKPWEDEKLKKLVKNIFEMKESLENKETLRLVSNIEYIPALKRVYHKLMEAIENDYDIDKIASIIEEDPSVAVQLLHVANSAFYNLKTSSIKNAVVYLGMINIKNILLNTIVVSSMKDGYERNLLWKHSYIANKITIFIYNNILNKKVPDNYTSSGLLHNIGEIVLYWSYKEKYLQYIKDLFNQKNEGIEIQKLERDYFGFSHCELGACLLDWWEFPYSLVEVAMFHHEPEKENIINKEIVSVVNIACYFSWYILGLKVLKKPDFAYIFLGFDKNCHDKLKNYVKELEMHKI